MSLGGSPDTQSYKATVRNLYNPHYSNPFGTITFNDNERQPKSFVIQKRGSADVRKIQTKDFSMYESSNKKAFDTIPAEQQSFNGQKIILPFFDRQKQKGYFHSIRKSAADQANPQNRLDMNLNLQDLNFKKIRLPLKQASKAFELKQRGRTIDLSLMPQQDTTTQINQTKDSGSGEVETNMDKQKASQFKVNKSFERQQIQVGKPQLPPIINAETPAMRLKQQRHYRNNSTLYESGMSNSLDLMTKFLKQKGQEQLQRSFALNGSGAIDSIQLESLPYQSYDKTSGSYALNNFRTLQREKSIGHEKYPDETSISPKSQVKPQFGIHNGCEIMIEAHKKYSDMSRFYKNIVDSRVGQHGKMSFMRPNIR